MSVRGAVGEALRGSVSTYHGFREKTAGPMLRREGPGRDVVVIISFGEEWSIEGERLESFAYRTEPAQLNRIRVRIPDRPGVLARITQILGAAQINLEDFELRHVSPEYGGVLVILVAGADNAERARELLRREGFAAA